MVEISPNTAKTIDKGIVHLFLLICLAISRSFASIKIERFLSSDFILIRPSSSKESSNFCRTLRSSAGSCSYGFLS